MKKGLKLLLVIDSFITLSLAMLGPIYALFVAEIGGDLLDASMAYFFFMLSSGLMIFVISKFEDTIKKKEYFITIGYLLTSIGAYAYIFVYNQFTLILVQILLGIAEAIQLPAYDSVYSHYIDKNKEASQWGNWEALTYITTAFGALIGGYLATIYGFSILFVFMGTLCFVGTLLSLKLFKSKKILNKE